MNPDTLIRIGWLLFGRRWRRSLGVALATSDERVRLWEFGLYKIPPYFQEKLKKLMREKATRLMTLVNHIDPEPVPETIVHLNDVERSTIMAALRVYQVTAMSGNAVSEQWWDLASDGGRLTPLTSKQVTALAKHINYERSEFLESRKRRTKWDGFGGTIPQKRRTRAAREATKRALEEEESSAALDPDQDAAP
jgi:hypothetical protein